MLRNNHRRAGLSLMEALVSLFIMAIGMISLLTLFPLGAIQMGRALRDDRCAQCAWQGDGVVRTWWQVEVVDNAADETKITAPYWSSLDAGIANPTTTTAPSKVVAIDPIGVLTRGNAPLAGSAITRQTSKFTTDSRSSIRACSLCDDLFFDETGIPDNLSGTVTDSANPSKKLIARQGRYNWMALIQRPVNSQRTTANLKILVFSGRPIAATSNGETLVAATGALNGTQVTVQQSLTNPAFPPLGKGGWIMDPGTGDRMDFYRVQSLTDNGTTTTLELDTPLKNAVTQVIVLRDLAEVFDRPILAPTPSIKTPTP